MEDDKATAKLTPPQQSTEIFATPKAYEIIMDPQSSMGRLLIETAQSFSFGEEIKCDYRFFLHAPGFLFRFRKAETHSEKNVIIISDRKTVSIEFDELLEQCVPVSFV